MHEKRSVFSSGKLQCAIIRCIPVRANMHNLIGSVHHRHRPNWVTGQKMDDREEEKNSAGRVEMVGGSYETQETVTAVCVVCPALRLTIHLSSGAEVALF